MTLTRGNAAIIDRSPELHLFVRDHERNRYEGPFACVDVEQVQALNKGTREAALVFVLQRVTATEAGEFSAVEPGATSRRPVVRQPIKAGEMPTVSAAGLPADPEQRRLRLEKALQSHREIVETLADVFARSGAACSEDSNSYDLLVEWPDGTALLVEAKSLNGPLGQRVRLAIGQLFEYRYRVRSDLGVTPQLAIATNRQIADPWLVEYLTRELGMMLITVVPAGVFATGDWAESLTRRVPALVTQSHRWPL
ncbi:MAG: hypothetical protein FJ028_06875 [Chloroflexi bacterium]|nr:hypothetical protein [Chloroflexota bacterium]